MSLRRFFLENMTDNNNDISDSCRHPGRRDRVFCGDTAGYNASHEDTPRDHDSLTMAGGFDEVLEPFKRSSRLSRSPPCAMYSTSKVPLNEHISKPNSWYQDCGESPDTILDPLSTNAPTRRHSSPEDVVNQSNKKGISNKLNSEPEVRQAFFSTSQSVAPTAITPEKTSVWDRARKHRNKRGLDEAFQFASPSLANSKSIKERFLELQRSNDPSASEDTPVHPTTKRAREEGENEDTLPNTEHIKQANSIARRLKKFVANPKTKLNKKSQEHINKQIERMVELMEIVVEESKLARVDLLPTRTRAAATQPSEAQDTKIVEAVMERVVPLINSGMERILNKMVERTNQIVNAPKSEGSKKPAPKKSNKIRSEPQSSPEVSGLNSNTHTHIATENSPNQWTTVTARRYSNPSRKEYENNTDSIVKRLIEKKSATENTASKIISVNIDLIRQGQGSAADKAAQLIDKIPIDPDDLGDKIHDVRIMNDGRIRVFTKDEEAANNIIKRINETNSTDGDMLCSISRGRLPRIEIRGIPQMWPAEKVKEVIAANCHNSAPCQATDGTIKALFKRGPKLRMTTAWVVLISPEIRKVLMAKKSVKYGFLTFPVSDYISLPRCFKCHTFGHIARTCTTDHQTCSWCAQKGHAHSLCPNKNANPKCCNCVGRGRRADHPATDPKCPAYQKVLFANVNNTDYG